MNIAQINQAKIKARIAAGETVTIDAPDYGTKPLPGGNVAQVFQQKKLAELVSQNRQSLDHSGNSDLNKEYDIIKASLEGDINTLAGLKTVKEKIAYKAHIIPNYLDYLQRYVAEERNHPNGILSQVLVWLFDTEQFDLAQQYADLAILQGQKLPTRFKTPNIETFICDTLYDYAAKQLKAKQPATALKYAFDGLCNGWDVNPVPASKVFAMAGKLANAAGELENAFDYCTKAQELNDQAGCKKLIIELVKKLALKTESEGQ